MNTDPSASRPQRDLVAIASNPNTDLEILRTLAYEYPHLRPVIALNPSAYEGLLQWLGDLGDDNVNAALRQRKESGPVFPSTNSEGEPANDNGEGAAETNGSDESDAGGEVESSDSAGAAAGGAGAADGAGAGATTGGFGATGGAGAADGPDETEVISPVAGMPATQVPARANSDAKVAAATATGAAGAQPDEKKNRSTPIIISILALVAVALVGLVIYFTTRSPASEDDLAATEATTQSEATEEATEAPTEPEETTEEPTEPELKYPAPDGTATIERIAAPSGNILCQLSKDAVTCTVLETNDGDAFGEKCSDGSVTVQATAEGVALNCDAKVSAEGMASVDYGNFGQFENFACGSQYNGVSCWNQETGLGLAVSRQGWTSSDKGFITEESYPWTQ